MREKGKKNSENVIGYLISYDPYEELSKEQAYDFWLYIVYSTDKLEYENEANILAENIKEKFSELTQKAHDSGSVRLLSCKAFSETVYSKGYATKYSIPI